MGPQAIAYALQLLSALPALIEGGASIVGLIQKGKEKLQQFKDEDREPSPVEWEELNDSIDAKREELHSA